MDSIYNMLSFQMIDALSWTLLHSIWQALLIACVLSLLIKHNQSLSSKSKSWISLAVLPSLIVVSVTTFFCYYDFASSSESLSTFVQEDARNVATYLGTEQTQTFSSIADRISVYSQYIVLAWLLGFVLFLLHLVFGLFQLHRLKQQLTPLSEYWQERLRVLANKINYSGKILMGESSNIQTPITFGFIKPVILFPVGMINQLSIQEVEAILAHELAHIVRKDYLINFLQTLLEGIYYFNPGVWIISSIIRNQREHCCDDIAIVLTGDSKHYVQAIIAVEENKNESYLAIGFSSNKKPLLERVQRILNQPQKNNSMKEKIIMCFIIISGFFFYSFQENPQTIEENKVNNTDVVENQTVNREENYDFGKIFMNELEKGDLTREDMKKSIFEFMIDKIKGPISEEEKKLNEIYKFDTSITTEAGRVRKRLQEKRTELIHAKNKLNNQSGISDKEVDILMQEVLVLYQEEIDLFQQYQGNSTATFRKSLEGQEQKLRQETNRIYLEGQEILEEFQVMQSLLSTSTNNESDRNGLITDLKNYMDAAEIDTYQNTKVTNTLALLITEKLSYDKLIQDRSNFYFVLTDGNLTIDGNVQSKEVYEKYKATINTLYHNIFTEVNDEIISFKINLKNTSLKTEIEMKEK